MGLGSQNRSKIVQKSMKKEDQKQDTILDEFSVPRWPKIVENPLRREHGGGRARPSGREKKPSRKA